MRLFNSGALKFLVCTSTLIEGVNTAAKTVIIYDNKIATKKYDFFTFNNIRGRAGRMRQHFIGRVYLFNEPPQAELPTVDIPILSQPSDLPMQVVVEMEERDVRPELVAKLDLVLEEGVLPKAIVRENRGVDPGEQMRLARKLKDVSDSSLRILAWNGVPNSEELRTFCELAWDAFPKFRPQYDAGVGTVGQLRRHLRILATTTIKQWIEQETGDPDSIVERLLLFTRNYCGFSFPRYARATERIIRHEQGRRGLPLANYGFYIGKVESLFLPPAINALDEYGVPSQISTRLSERSELSENLDAAVQQVEDAARAGQMSEFESRIVLSALGLEELVLSK